MNQNVPFHNQIKNEIKFTNLTLKYWQQPDLNVFLNDILPKHPASLEVQANTLHLFSWASAPDHSM